MSLRFICPHCHSPVEPQRMDVAVSDQAACRICPECDEPIVLATPDDPSVAVPAIAVANLGESTPREDVTP